MAYTYEQLSKMTVVELRKIADGIQHDATKGHSTMHKEKLLPALCVALGIEAHVHHEVKGINKAAMKTEIKQTQRKRDEALKNGNREEFKVALHRIHDLKRAMRRAMV
jgi:arginine utilization protein RocB